MQTGTQIQLQIESHCNCCVQIPWHHIGLMGNIGLSGAMQAGTLAANAMMKKIVMRMIFFML